MFPYEATIRTAGAESVMNANHDIDGIPCASSERLLTDVLRGEWRFDGRVVSDYYSVDFLRAKHGVADSDRESGVMALEAGINVELPATDYYEEPLSSHRVRRTRRDNARRVGRRVLRAKFRKGVFSDPTVDADADNVNNPSFPTSGEV